CKIEEFDCALAILLGRGHDASNPMASVCPNTGRGLGGVSIRLSVREIVRVPVPQPESFWRSQKTTPAPTPSNSFKLLAPHPPNFGMGVLQLAQSQSLRRSSSSVPPGTRKRTSQA